MKNFNYKYTVRDFIDKNKWSNVYTGVNHETNENVIINILINLEGNEENLEIFKDEVNLLKDINSSNVTSINNISTYVNKDKIYYYIESENFEGLTLDELTRINKLNEKQCLRIIKEVINGVKELNNKKINFCNLTSENIIINGDGIVKIDILSFINNHKGHINCKRYNSKKFDSQKDIYAIGIILCEMITGKKSFNPEENKNLDKDISKILEKSTNKQYTSKYKYKNLSELLNDINLYLDGEEIGYNSTLNFEKIYKIKYNPNIKKHIALICVALIFLSGLVFGSTYLINKNDSSDVVTDVSEDISKIETTPDNNHIKNITPIEENLIITTEDKSESNEEELDDKNNELENDNKDDSEQNQNKDELNEDNSDDNSDKENVDNNDKEDLDNENIDNNEENSDNENIDNNDEDLDEDSNNTDDKENTNNENNNDKETNQNENLNNNENIEQNIKEDTNN